MGGETSHLCKLQILPKGHNLGGPSHQGSEAALSDQELEAKGNSWLKSSNPLRDSLRVTLPSIGESKNYSKDSLDNSDDESYSSKIRYRKILLRP